MSGPKVVDFTAVRLQQERAWRRMSASVLRELQRLRESIKDIDDISQQEHITSISARVEKLIKRFSSAQDIRTRNDFLAELTSHLELIRESSKRFAETRIRAKELAFRQQLMLHDAIEATLVRLEVAGLAELAAELSGSRSEEMLEKSLVAIAEIEAKKRSNASQEILEDIAGKYETNSIDEWIRALPEAERIDDERIVRLIAQLSEVDGLEQVTTWKKRAEEIVNERERAKRKLRTDSLIIELNACLRQRLVERDRLSALDDMESELAAFEDVPQHLSEQLELLREDSLKDTGAFIREARAWCAAEAERIDVEVTHNSILLVLRELGYDVREGMGAAWAKEGKLVVQQPGSGGYGVQFSTLPNERVKTELVRFSDGSHASHGQEKRDLEVETEWCATHAKILEQLAGKGVDGSILTARPVGSTPVKVIPATSGAERGRERTAPDRLKGKEL